MRPFRILCTVALAGALLAGCGGDDEAAGSNTSGSGTEEGFCAAAQGLIDRFASLDDTTEPTPEIFRDVSDAFGELATEAPGEIADDMETLSSTLATFAEVFEDVDVTDADSLAALEDQAERIEAESENLEEASENVESYLRDECGIDLADVPDQADGEGGEPGG